MMMKLPDLAAFKAVSLRQKITLLAVVLAAIGLAFYYYVESPEQETIARLNGEIAKLDQEIHTNKAKTKSLEDLKRVNAELQQQLVKNQEQLPPEDEAATLLKQISDLGVRIGLNFKLWKPGARGEDPSKLFVRMPVDVEMSGGYHTLALFFDRIGKLPRIINVSKIKMGSGTTQRGRVSIQTTFELTAFASPKNSMAGSDKTEAAAKPGGM
jgi:type IV pilus assembly protein PilO